MSAAVCGFHQRVPRSAVLYRPHAACHATLRYRGAPATRGARVRALIKLAARVFASSSCTCLLSYSPLDRRSLRLFILPPSPSHVRLSFVSSLRKVFSARARKRSTYKCLFLFSRTGSDRAFCRRGETSTSKVKEKQVPAVISRKDTRESLFLLGNFLVPSALSRILVPLRKEKEVDLCRSS